uniref:Uncharacterized protein n=1 Tax=Heterorhabditis bacteriophora TaxID=37862 RepID=A0A1I7WZ36_HETBA
MPKISYIQLSKINMIYNINNYCFQYT